jgi:hypothetical protein
MRGCAVLLEVNASLLVIFVEKWNEELLEQIQMHDTCDGCLREEKEGVVHSFAEGAKYVRLWAVTNMLQGYTWICAAPDLTVVGIDLTTDTKHALIVGNLSSSCVR